MVNALKEKSHFTYVYNSIIFYINERTSPSGQQANHSFFMIQIQKVSHEKWFFINQSRPTCFGFGFHTLNFVGDDICQNWSNAFEAEKKRRQPRGEVEEWRQPICQFLDPWFLFYSSRLYCISNQLHYWNTKEENEKEDDICQNWSNAFEAEKKRRQPRWSGGMKVMLI